MKFWKKQLKDEFDAAVPELRPDVISAPIMAADSDSSDLAVGNVLAKRRIGIFSACAAALLAAVFLLLGVLGVFSPAPVSEKLVFTFEINPAVCFITDESGKVQTVKSLNGDADVILSDKSTLDKLENVQLSDALVEFTDCAVKLGYLNPDGAENAVRLRYGADSELTASASDALKSFFKTKGIYAVVVEDKINANELSASFGIAETDNFSDLATSISELSARFGERVAYSTDGEKLQDLYKSYVLGAQMLESVREMLLENVEKIISNAQAVSKMTICNYNIMAHKDNPLAPFPADYWMVKNYSDMEYSTDFAGLMDEMDGLILDYENKFGVKINQTADLNSAAEIYSSLSGIDFRELFLTLDSADFQTSAPKYVAMLKNIGWDVTELESLLSPPQTVQEYISQMQTALDQQVISRTERFKEVYGQTRNEISEAQYAAYVKFIELKYGSLENFWNKK